MTARNNASGRVSGAVVLGVVAVLTLFGWGNAAQGFTMTRLAGGDRYDTARVVALASFPSGATDAVIASGEAFPDALVGSFVAGQRNAPILLTPTNVLAPATAQALAALGVRRVTLIGGPAAIASGVEDQLRAVPAPGGGTITVTRIAGATRYETAEMASRAGPIGSLDGRPTAIVATGVSFADALAAGPLAWGAGFPILLTTPDALAASARAALQGTGARTVLVLGGVAAVSQAVEDEIAGLDGVVVERIQGANRYGTSVALWEFAMTRVGFKTTHVNLARGDDPAGFADALAVGPHGGADDPAGVLLTPPTAAAPEVLAALTARSSTLLGGHLAGGILAVPDDVKRAHESAASGVPVSTSTTTATEPPVVVNPRPVADAQSLTMNEDDPGLTITLTGSDPQGQAITFGTPTSPGHGTLSGTAPDITYTPDENYFGSDSFTFTVNDGTSSSAPATVSITVNAVNDAPAFTGGANQTVREDAGAQSVSGWATAISSGAANETQNLTFVLTGDTSPSLFAAGPAVSPTGTLTYMPAADTFGSADITVELHDDGGTANGGDDTSSTYGFTVTVTSVNDPPSFASGGDVVVLEDSGSYSAAWAGSVAAGPADESSQSVTFDVSTDANGLFSLQPALAPNGTLTFTPAANAFGSATVTVTASDDGGTANGGDDTAEPQTFSITVKGVNDEPGFDLPGSPNQAVLQDSGAHTVAGFATNITAGPNESGQTLTFTVTNDNTSLFSADGQPDVDEATGDLTYRPAAAATGSATVSVTLSDDGGTADGGDDTSATETFTITVTPPNATPTDITITPSSIEENNTPPTTVGTLTTADADTGDTHTYSLVSGSGDGDNGSFSIAGDLLRINVAADFETTPSYSVRVQTDDGHGGTFAEALTITVNDVNETPTDITLSSSTIAENNAPGATVGTLSATDPDTGATHTFTLVAGSGDIDNAAFTITGSTLTITASADFETKSSYSIRVRVTDGSLTFEKPFTISVTNVNEAPTGIALSPAGIAENNAPGATVGTLSATDPDASATHTFAFVSGTGDTDNAGFTITGSTLTINGTADFETKPSHSIRVRATDAGGLTLEEALTITVINVNEAPVAAADAQTVSEDGPAAVVDVIANDADPDGDMLVVTAVNTVGTVGTVTITNSGANVTYNPNGQFESLQVGQAAQTTFTYTVTDGSLTDTETVTITIEGANDSPVAVNDSFSGAIGNTKLAVGVTVTGEPVVNVSGNLLTDDSDVDNSMTTAVASVESAPAGAAVTVNADGTFTYVAPPGFEGTGTFDYRVTDGNGGVDIGTVSITVNEVVWYVDNTKAAGNGTSVSPYSSLAPLTAAGDLDDPDDLVFVYQGSGAYTGGLTLEATQKLWGQPLGLVVNNGAGNVTLVAAGGTNPTIAGGLVLGSGVDVQAVTLGAHSGFALSGTNVGSSTVGQASGAAVSVNNTAGGGVSLSTGTPTVILTSVTSTGGTNGISLSSLTGGSFTANGGSLSGASGAEILVNGGGANVAIASSVTNTAGRSVDVQNRTAGSVTLSGAIGDTGQGILLNANTAGAVNFTGTLALNTGTNAAFTATAGGTVSASDAASTIATTTGTALNVTNTTIGSAGLRFRSISAGTAVSGPANGIVLNNTGATGGLTVSGTGAAGSGGTIQRTTGAGIGLTGTRSPSFTNMAILDTAGDGVDGTQVTNFTFTDGRINNSGSTAVADTSNIGFNDTAGGTQTNLTGTVVITGNSLTNAAFQGIDIFNYNGAIADANISNNTITSSTSADTSKGSGIRLVAFGNASTVAAITKATIDNNVITNFPSGVGLQVQGGNANSPAAPIGTVGTPGSGTNVVDITNNQVSGANAGNRIGAEGMVVLVNGRGQGNFNISNNAVSHVTGQAISHSAFGLANVTSTISGNTIVANNTVGSPGIGVGTGVTFSTADTPSLTTTIIGNNVSNSDGNGILAVARGATGTLRVKIQNNTVAAPLTGVRPGIRVDAGNSSSVDDAVCLNISGNTSAGSGGSQGIGLRKQGTTPTTNDFGVNGMAATSSPEVEAYVNGLNPAGGGTLLISATSGFSNCSLP